MEPSRDLSIECSNLNLCAAMKLPSMVMEMTAKACGPCNLGISTVKGRRVGKRAADANGNIAAMHR